MKLTPEDKLILNAAAKQGRKEYLEKKRKESKLKRESFKVIVCNKKEQ